MPPNLDAPRIRDAREATLPRPARGARSPPYVVGFYLVPEFPMMAFASAIEPLRAANRLLGEQRFDWRLYSRDCMPVRASNRRRYRGAWGDRRRRRARSPARLRRNARRR